MNGFAPARTDVNRAAVVVMWCSAADARAKAARAAPAALSTDVPAAYSAQAWPRRLPYRTPAAHRADGVGRAVTAGHGHATGAAWPARHAARPPAAAPRRRASGPRIKPAAYGSGGGGVVLPA